MSGQADDSAPPRRASPAGEGADGTPALARPIPRAPKALASATGGLLVELARLSTEEVSALLAREGRKIALLVTGSTEAHGPHLPLSTDVIIGREMARRTGDRLAQRGDVAVLLPDLNYAVTDWAAPFAGTITLSRETAHALVFEVCVQAMKMGFARVIVCNAHLEPDNVAVLRDVAKHVHAATGAPLVFPDVTRRASAMRLGEEFASGSCHAGEYESSLVAAVDERLVDCARARALPDLHVPIHERWRDGARDFLSAGMPQAYCGSPRSATRDKGEGWYEVLVALAIEALDASFAPVVGAP